MRSAQRQREEAEGGRRRRNSGRTKRIICCLYTRACGQRRGKLQVLYTATARLYYIE